MSKRIFCAGVTVLMLFLCALPAFANAAEPPCFTILVNDAPEDLTITLITPDGLELPLSRIDRGWETCFRGSHYYDFETNRKLALEDFRQSELRITSAELDVKIHMPVELVKEYNTVFQLKWPDIVLTETYLFWRTPLLVTMRVLITLVTEGIVLWLFGYRQKRSWILFAVVNLATQTFLNLVLTGQIPPEGYWWIAYIFCEVWIFLAEAVLYALFVPEKGRGRAALAAVCANAVSLVTGALLLSYLPI